MIEGQETCGKVHTVLGCSDASHRDVLDSAYLLHHVRESLKKKGLLLGEARTARAAAAAAAPADVVHEKSNLHPIMEDDTRCFKDRDVAWILARENSRKRNKQPRSLDFSSFVQVEMLSSEDIQSILVEGMHESYPEL